MLVLNPPSKPVRSKARTTQANPARELQSVAVGLGSVQLLLDIGQVEDAQDTLRAIRDQLQALRRSSPR